MDDAVIVAETRVRVLRIFTHFVEIKSGQIKPSIWPQQTGYNLLAVAEGEAPVVRSPEGPQDAHDDEADSQPGQAERHRAAHTSS
jgi:hypothetical protein